jgi:hypothetical protein
MRSLLSALLSLAVLPACLHDGIAGDDVASLDCDAQRAQFDEAGGYAMTIGADGTVYLGRGDAIARLGTDGSIDLLWQRRAGAVWDELAVTPTRLYATDRTSGVVAFELGRGAAQPGELVMTGDVASFGAVGDPDGGLYFSHDEAPGIGRLWPGGVVVSDVTIAPLPGPIGDLAFGTDRALYVIEMFGGDVHRIVLDGAHRELSRELIAETGLPFGLALDVDGHGRLYYGGQGTVYRRSPPYRAEDEEVLAEGLEAIGKIEVGRGPTCPADVYVSAIPGVALAP